MIKNTFFSLLLVILVLLLFEVLLRVLVAIGHRSGIIDFFTSSYVLTETAAKGSITSYDRRLGYKYLPNRTFVLRTGEYEHEINTVELGFKDIGFRDNGVQRKIIAVAVGDSITACIGVEYQHCWVKILEDRIKLDVVNMGVGGYSSVQKRIVAEEYSLKLKPKVILFEINSSDPCDDFYFVNKLKFPIPHPFNSFVDKDIRSYFASLVLINFLIERYYYGYTPEKRYKEYYSKCSPGTKYTIQSIEEVHSRCKHLGVSFVLLIFHKRFLPSELRRYLDENEERINIIDFATLEERAEGIYHKDGHFNIKGNIGVAEVVYSHLVDLGVLEE